MVIILSTPFTSAFIDVPEIVCTYVFTPVRARVRMQMKTVHMYTRTHIQAVCICEHTDVCNDVLIFGCIYKSMHTCVCILGLYKGKPRGFLLMAWDGPFVKVTSERQ